MRQVGSVVSILILSFVGLLVGAWQFVAPWVIGFEQNWTRATWAYVWTAALVMAVSGIALVVVSFVSVRSALQFAAARRAAEGEKEGDEEAPEVTSPTAVR